MLAFIFFPFFSPGHFLDAAHCVYKKPSSLIGSFQNRVLMSMLAAVFALLGTGLASRVIPILLAMSECWLLHSNYSCIECESTFCVPSARPEPEFYSHWVPDCL